MKIIVKAKDFAHAAARMNVAGLRVRDAFDGEGNPVPREALIEDCLTYDMTCTDGDVVFSCDVDDDYMDKIPTNDSPNFTVEWREDDLVDDGEGNMVMKPKPTFEVNAYDDLGAVIGTHMQLCGVIS